MNARQKAKHYKKQLEQMKVPVQKIFITENTLVHYRSIKAKYPYERHDVAEQHAKYEILQELKEVVDGFTKFDPETNVFRFDFWVKR